MDYQETPKMSQAQRWWVIRRYKPIRLIEKILHEEEKLAREQNQELQTCCCLEPGQTTPQLQGIERKLKRRSYRPRTLFPRESGEPELVSAGYSPPSSLQRAPSPAQYRYSPEQYETSPVACAAATPYGEEYEYEQYPETENPYVQAAVQSLPANRPSPVPPTYRCLIHSEPARYYQPEEEAQGYEQYVQPAEFDVPSPPQLQCMHYPEGDSYRTPVQYHHLASADGSEEQKPYIDPLDDFEHFKKTIIAALQEDQEDYASLMHFLNSEEDILRFHDLFLEYKENKIRNQGYA